MKLSFFVVPVISFLLFSCNGSTATSYNDIIIEPQLEVIEILDSIYAGSEVSVENIKKHREKLVLNTDKALGNIRNLKDYKGNTSFKEAAIKYFSHLSFHYKKTKNIDSLIYFFNSEERIGNMKEEDYNFMERELNKYLELEKTLLNEQKMFAEKFNMRLEY